MHPAELAILLHRALEARRDALQELLAPADWASDVEQLHQARVAARRLRAVLDLVDAGTYPGQKRERRALKDLVGLLGRSRELDVHAAWLEARRGGGTPPREAAAEHLLERLDHARAKARRTMGRELGHLRLPDLRKRLEAPNPPSPSRGASLQEAAWGCLAPRVDAALGDLTALAAREDAAALHRARVRIKKLRYAVEALEGAFAAPPGAALAELKALQDALGSHHDLAALEVWLQEIATDLRARDRSVLQTGVLELLSQAAEARSQAFGHFTALAAKPVPAALAAGLRQALGLPGEGTTP